MALIAATTASTCGDPTILRSAGPYSENAAPLEGLRYFPARDLLSVDARVVRRRWVRWGEVDTAGRCVAGEREDHWHQTTWDVVSSPVPDRTHVYLLGVKPSNSAEQTLKLGVSDDGLLTTLNYSSRDQTADIAGSILKGVVGIAGVLIGSRTARVPVRKPRQTAIEVTQDSTEVNDESCYVRFAGAPAQALSKERNTLQMEITKARESRAKLLQRAENAASLAEVNRLRGQDDLLERREVLLTRRLETVRAALAAGISAYTASMGVARSDTTIQVFAHFDVADLPDKLPGKDRAHADRALTDKPAAQDLLRRANMVLVVSSLPPSLATGPDTKADTSSIGCTKENKKDCASIHFRSPILRVVSVYVTTGEDDTSSLVLRERRSASLVSSKDPILSVTIESVALGEMGVNYSFGKRGNIIGVEQSSSAALANATNTLANALTSARQEFVAGLQTVQTTQSSIESMRQTARTSRIRELQDRKAVIDAQIALDGANENRALLTEKQSLDAEIALLMSQQALASAQQSSTPELAEMRAELARLKTELELLQKQLELEKARRAVEEARAARPPE